MENSILFKIFLIVDNTHACPPLPDHPNIKVVFLPPNYLFDLASGVIASFKTYYLSISFVPGIEAE